MAEKDIPVHMVSDGPGNVGKVYGIYDENAGVELRGRFIIDPDGVIRYHWPEVIPKGHAERVARTLTMLQGKAK